MKRIVKWFKDREVLEIITADFETGRITSRKPRWQLQPVVAWYDLWVGFYIDCEKRRVYFFPLPCLGVVFFWG